MRRRGFFTKLLFGTAGAVAGATAGREGRAQPTAVPTVVPTLVWVQDSIEVVGGEPLFLTTCRVVARSLVVELNGVTLALGEGRDYQTVSRAEEAPYVSVLPNPYVLRPRDLLVLRYQTWEVPA